MHFDKILCFKTEDTIGLQISEATFQNSIFSGFTCVKNVSKISTPFWKTSFFLAHYRQILSSGNEQDTYLCAWT